VRLFKGNEGGDQNNWGLQESQWMNNATQNSRWNCRSGSFHRVHETDNIIQILA
jgi:hypothetical protein